jgi:XisH protein
MPAKNAHHDTVREALIADGWTVTHDPLTLFAGERVLHVDLGAERADGGAVAVIAVEVQTIDDPSPVADLQQATGQFVMYRTILEAQQPDRTLYLAVTDEAYNGFLSEPLGVIVTASAGLKWIVFDPTQRRIVRWTS